MFRRASGLLLHVTSLPGGRMGEEARRFVDFCADAGQRWWQVLPLLPPDRGHSPYTALSAFAGNENLLPVGPSGAREPGARALEAFRRRNAHWLPDYALFRAIRDTQGGASWVRWPRGLRDRERAALARARRNLAEAVNGYERRQFRFDVAWRALRRYARSRGVRLLGDVAFFVSFDSADVWAHRELFKLDARGRPTVIAGVPPDYFSRTGQLWGNPHYRWERHRRQGYAWWIARLRHAFRYFDAIRLDHFLGLLRAWEVPVRARTARRGRWAPGPADDLLRAVHRALGRPRIIAEDLGLVTPAAIALRRRFGLPGIRVLQFSFGDAPEDLPHRFPRDCVAYTGTHDNNTTVGWFREGGEDRERARAYAGGRRDRIHWSLIRAALASPAELAIVPVQDLLGLGEEARMNRPGKARGNWCWRLREGQIGPAHARRLRALTEATRR